MSKLESLIIKEVDNSSDWFKKAVAYQIYPKSFKDSNNDGVGDIRGIIEKLDYIKNLGVDVIWLTPIYVSPQNDNGYDIADYYNIDPLFGTMEDFEELLKKVHEKGMKLITDMVVNHTSIEHKWFKEALKGEDNPYHDFYIWKKVDGENPPNNWVSKFGGSAWKYVEHLDKYYLHLFDVTQADLNWENPKLREEIYKMINFWLEKGIDGFRLDVINLLSKDQSFPNDTFESSNHDGRRFYTDGFKIHEYIHEINKNTFSKYKGSMTVGEMSSTSIDHCIKYTRPENEELSMTFSFHHLKVDYPNGEKWALGKFNFMKLKKLLFDWQLGMQEGGGWNAMFWCNHDQPRIVSRFGNDKKYHRESATMLATSIHLMQGTPYIYQGEEIGMTNAGFESIEQYRDIEAINAYNMILEKGISKSEAIEILKNKSRDNSRTPMQWDPSENGGFTNVKPWMDLSYNYKDINVEKDLSSENSIYKYYRKLADIRKSSKIISHGRIDALLEDHDKVLAYKREFEGEEIIVICNFFDFEVKIELKEFDLSGSEIILNNYIDAKLSDEINLRPYEALAIKL
ncbi:alpha,alpha-phosphotrehalase [Clostridium sp. CCUG 7971]|uniref:alpha,alpha-phosphotrehalase n=1 Tax=Clostridium sp. CCUG 7971 TaxID=2811414 RepID=UPI001ABAA6ED|nr:alpha,alpha-phosphotrehalase [Clostridium sp. CCUG 7971]MBO3443833.1 alpha,alpha-phosphotrehalase [Clostridium sp. CCUG 7971]